MAAFLQYPALYWFAVSAGGVLGLAVGSFLNSFIYRLERGEGVIFSERRKLARSRCPACRRGLNWFELIPLVSFFALGRRCRTCRVQISWQYPIVEFLTAVLFVLIFWQVASQSQPASVRLITLLFELYVAAVFVVVAVFDARAYVIPDRVIWPAIFTALVYNGVRSLLEQDFLMFLGALGAGLGAAGFFWLIVVFSRGRWLGLGDVKLVAFLGLVLGWPRILPALALAFWSGAIVGGALLAAGRKKISSPIPFGPYLVFGALTVMLLGDVISQTWWFVRFLF
ncbi:prepilin peptidase [Candidatus Parcubacteria bacterium]|nr:prepilin peptidase [Candidatus Parcubacteria bacterium]